jgi:hypothetical protein
MTKAKVSAERILTEIEKSKNKLINILNLKKILDVFIVLFIFVVIIIVSVLFLRSPSDGFISYVVLFLINVANGLKQISPSGWIALSSFLISFITLWVTIISPAKISAKIGNNIAVYFVGHTKNGNSSSLLSFCLSLDMFNGGARTGLIENIALKVRFGDNRQKYPFKVSREIAEIQVYSIGDDVDKDKMRGNLRDPFASIMLVGKSILHKKYLFWPADEEELSIEDIKIPFKIIIEVFLQIKGRWEKQGEVSFNNQTIKIKEKSGWALIESEESLNSINKLNS